MCSHPCLKVPFVQVLSALFAAAVLTGCSGKPSERTGEAIMEKRIVSQSNGNIRLVRFTKTNATGDDNSYQMEFEAEIMFMATGTWTRGSSMDPAVSFEFSPQQMAQTPTMGFMAAAMGAENVQHGQHVTIKGVLRFEKTEQGWRGEDGQVY